MLRLRPRHLLFQAFLLALAASSACQAPSQHAKSGSLATPVSEPAAAPVAAPVATPAVAEHRTPAQQIIDLARRDNQVMQTVRTISKEHPKRLTGSKGYDRAAQWALEQFRTFGLEARLEKWGTFKIAFDRGVQRGRILASGTDDPAGEPLTFATMAWTAGTKGKARGRAVLEPRTEAELGKLDPKKDFAGAWIVHTETKEGAKLRRKLRDAYEEAGVLGTLRRGASSGLLTMGGNHNVDPEKLPERPDVKVLAKEFDALVERLEKGEKIDVELEIENVFGATDVPCHNVIADIVGTRFPDEYVIVQGHFDAWDGAEGAQDNATGSGTTMEAARLIMASGLKPLRTIRFILYSGEEQGLFGSEGYVREHADELDKVSIVMNHDGGGTFLAGLDATYAMLQDMNDVCAPLVGLDARFPFQVHEVDGLVNSGDSDHAPFLGEGVPAFFWHQSEKNYTYVHHTQNDVFEEIDPAQVEHSAIVVAVAAFGFASLDHLLDRTDMKPPPSRRRLGVRMDDSATVQQVTEDGKAQKAGWKPGDRIVAIDGDRIFSQAEVTSKLQLGPGKKKIEVERGKQKIESEFDWTGEAAERERAARAERRAAFLKAKSKK